MRAKPKLTVSCPPLQELLDPPKHIPQMDMVEYFNARHAQERDRFEVENLGSHIMQKLILGLPVQSGQLTASLDSRGRLWVIETPR